MRKEAKGDASMKARVWTITAAAALAAVALATTACDRLPGVIAALTGSNQASTTVAATGTPDATGGATGTLEATDTGTTNTSGGDAGTAATEVSHGRIWTPAMGNSTRVALMDAARSGLNTSSQFVVHQLWVQGNAAIGDIQPTKGGQRHFVIWIGPDWKVVWAAPYGSSKANAARAARDVPRASAQLIGKINFKYVPGPSLADMKASARAKTAAWYNGLLKQIPGPHGHAVTTAARMYKDGDGVWWAGVGVQSSTGSLEGTDVIWRWSGGKWHKFSIAGSDGFYPAVPKSIRVGLGYNF
jgi:hypothetical protein